MKKQAIHSHPVIRDAGLPIKKVPNRLVIKVKEKETDSTQRTRKKRVSCCG